MTVMLLSDNEVGLQACALPNDRFVNWVVELGTDKDLDALAS